MGFGYLFIGYLITFLLSLTVQALGFGGVALLVGYGVMLGGLWILWHYQSAFVWAKWLLVPLLVTALYRTLGDFNELLLLGLPIFEGVWESVYTWVTLALITAFNLAMLYGVGKIARDVGLEKTAVAAGRNAIFVGIYTLLTIVAKLPLPQTVLSYLTFPLIGFDLLWIVCNLLLLLSCTKDICPAGDEDQPQKPSRIGFLDRLNRAYEQNRQRAVETKTRETEAYLRRRKEKREQKQKK